jgi:hypothetical protein
MHVRTHTRTHAYINTLSIIGPQGKPDETDIDRTEVTVQEINSATSLLASKQYLSWSVQECFRISRVTSYWQRDAFPG